MREKMVTAVELAKFAEKNGWIMIEKNEKVNDNFIRYLTPSGQRVIVEFHEDGSIMRIYP